MANISVTDVQGTKFYLVDTTVSITTPTNAAAAVAAGEELVCVQSIGDIGWTAAVNEYSCIDSNATSKSRGSVSLGNQELSLLFNALDTGGQDLLRTMALSGERKQLVVVLNDNAGVSPTYFFYTVFLSGQTIPIAKDAAVLFNTTLEIASFPEYILATAV
jgi:hypothetical protein